MFEAGQTLTIKLPNGKLEPLTVVEVTGRMLDTVIVTFSDGARDALHVSRLAALLAR